MAWLGVVLLVGCGDRCGSVLPADTEASSSGLATTAEASTLATGGACPDAPRVGGYDPCPGPCGEDGQCLSDAESFAVCTRGCFTDCDCWPGTGEAAARCSDALLSGVPICVLDCSAGQACPEGTSCVEALGICAHPWVEGMDSTGSGSGSGTDSGTDSGTGSSSGGSSSSGLGSEGSSSGSTSSGSTSSGSTSSGSTSEGSSSGSGTSTSGGTTTGTSGAGSTAGAASTGSTGGT